MIIATATKVGIQEEGGEAKDFPSTGDGYDYAGVNAELKRLKDARPDRHEVKIQSEDTVKYADLVKIIDACTGLDMKALTLTPTAQ
jgi:biopolymer transport protein ExbD